MEVRRSKSEGRRSKVDKASRGRAEKSFRKLRLNVEVVNLSLRSNGEFRIVNELAKHCPAGGYSLLVINTT